MRKIILFVVFVLIGMLTIQYSKVYACNNWCAGSTCAVPLNKDGSCSVWATTCCDGVWTGQICSAGYYACNNSNGCCPIGGGGGGGNYYVHDGCSPYGLILKCGTPDPAQFACKNSQGGCWGNWPGPVGQPTGDECNTDHPHAPNHTECQTNCWCESPCDANAWQACSTSCGWGVQYNACGTPRSCIVNDPNSWGAWSACSATCGGGTQTRLNACGATQSPSCQVAGRILKIRAV